MYYLLKEFDFVRADSESEQQLHTERQKRLYYISFGINRIYVNR